MSYIPDVVIRTTEGNVTLSSDIRFSSSTLSWIEAGDNDLSFIRLFAMSYIKFLEDSPLRKDVPAKKKHYVNFYRTLEKKDLKTLVLEYKGYADTLLREAYATGSEEPTPFVGGILTTPISKEYMEWRNSRSPELLRFILSFLWYGKKLYFSDSTLQAKAMHDWYENESRLAAHSFDKDQLAALKDVVGILLGDLDVSKLLPVFGSGKIAERGIDDEYGKYALLAKTSSKLKRAFETLHMFNAPSGNEALGLRSYGLEKAMLQGRLRTERSARTPGNIVWASPVTGKPLKNQSGSDYYVRGKTYSPMATYPKTSETINSTFGLRIERPCYTNRTRLSDPEVTYKTLSFSRLRDFRGNSYFPNGWAMGWLTQEWSSEYKSPEEELAYQAMVPRDMFRGRVICMEPADYSFYQQEVMRWMYESMENSTIRRFVDLKDQSRNREAALYGSAMLSLDTIDLSNASDSVSLDLVKAVFPRKWLYYLLATRSRRVKTLDGAEQEAVKFAPMGSATCFPTQCIIFTAIAILGYDAYRQGKQAGKYRPTLSDIKSTIGWIGRDFDWTRSYTRKAEPLFVYGDDIICDTRVTDNVITLLNSFGFVVNIGKSFTGSQSFRESCGIYAYEGNDVTPQLFRLRPLHEKGKIRASNLIKVADGVDGVFLSTRYVEKLGVVAQAATRISSLSVTGYASTIENINNIGDKGYRHLALYLTVFLKGNTSHVPFRRDPGEIWDLCKDEEVATTLLHRVCQEMADTI